MRPNELNKFVEGFIEAHRKDVINSPAFLSFTLCDELAEGREKLLFGDKDYPYLHAKLEVPSSEVAKRVKKFYGIDFYELSLHVNTTSPMHNAYCALVESTDLFYDFKERNMGIVKLDHAQELENLLNETGKLKLDGIETIGTAFGPQGIICQKDEKDKLISVRYKEMPVKEFFGIANKIDGLELVDYGSGGFYYELGDESDPKSVLRKHTTALVLSILNYNGKPKQKQQVQTRRS
ncbi:MAG: hypothetical protein WC614_07070 [bacterium]